MIRGMVKERNINMLNLYGKTYNFQANISMENIGMEEEVILVIFILIYMMKLKQKNLNIIQMDIYMRRSFINKNNI